MAVCDEELFAEISVCDAGWKLRMQESEGNKLNFDLAHQARVELANPPIRSRMLCPVELRALKPLRHLEAQDVIMHRAILPKMGQNG